MKNLDDSLELIYSALLSLTTMTNQLQNLETKEEMMQNIEKLEEARRLLYDAKNDLQRVVS